MVGAGSFGTAVAVLLARGGFRTTLQTRTREQCRRLEADRENKAYLPGVELPRDLRIEPAAEGLARADYVFLGVPSRGLEEVIQGLEQARARPPHAGDLAGQGARPARRDRPDGDAVGRARATGASRAWAVPRTPARWSRTAPGSSPPRSTSASRARSPTSSCAPAWSASSPATRSASSSRAWPRTPPRWPRARRRRSGLNAAGAAAGHIFQEVWRYAERQGARPESLIGLAGTGDLVGTALAPQSRNRRAGELLGKGVPAAEIPERIGQAVEALDMVPLLAAALDRAGVEAPVTDALRRLIAGELPIDDWVAQVRATVPPPARFGPRGATRRAWEQARAWVRRRSRRRTAR